MKHFTRRNSLVIAFLTAVILSFQNCNQVRYASIVENNPLNPVSENNGGSYEGKPDGTFYRFIPGYTCEQTQASYAFITIFSQSYFLTRNTPQMCEADTQSISALRIDSSVYQKTVIGYLEGIYELKEVKPVATPAKIVEVWCKSSHDLSGWETIAYHDSVADKNSAIFYYSTQNVDGSYTPQVVSEFDVSSVTAMGKTSVQNPNLGYETLVYDYAPSAIDPNQYEGRIQFVFNGQEVQKPASCRLGGRLDPAN